MSKRKKTKKEKQTAVPFPVDKERLKKLLEESDFTESKPGDHGGCASRVHICCVGSNSGIGFCGCWCHKPIGG